MIQRKIVTVEDVEFEVFYTYEHEEGRWTLDNGDPGYPGYSSLEIHEIYISDVEVSGVISQRVYDQIHQAIEQEVAV